MIDLSLIFFYTFWGIYSLPKESKCRVVFLSINYQTQCVSLLCLSSGIKTYIRFFILGKTPLIVGSWLKYLIIFILLKGWRRAKNFYPHESCYYVPFLLSWYLYLLLWLLFLLLQLLSQIYSQIQLLITVKFCFLVFFLFHYEQWRRHRCHQ